MFLSNNNNISYGWLVVVVLVLSSITIGLDIYKGVTDKASLTRLLINSENNVLLACINKNCSYVRSGGMYYIPNTHYTRMVRSDEPPDLVNSVWDDLLTSHVYLRGNNLHIYSRNVGNTISLFITITLYLIMGMLIIINVVNTKRIKLKHSNDFKRLKDSSALENNLKMLVAATAHHEMLTPVAVIKTSLKKLKKYGLYTNTEEFNVLTATVCRLEAVLNQLSADRQVYKKPRSSYYKIVDTAIKSIQILCTEYNFTATIVNEELLKKYSSYKLDTGTVSNILNNLFKNSLEAGATNIEVIPLVNDNVLTLYIADNGCGIHVSPEESTDIIFDLKYSNKTYNINILDVNNRLKSPLTGSGDGLYLIRSILRNVGGEVSLARTTSNGAVFKVTFPITKIEDS